MEMDARRHYADLAVAVATRRDRNAFVELFDFFAPRIKSFLMRQGMPGGEAEELAQEVMIVLWQKADLYDPAKSSLSTWLFRIARNRRIDAARRKRDPDLDHRDPLLIPSAPMAADEMLDMEDKERLVREAIETLPEEQVDLIRRAFFLGQSHSEIADDTGLPLGTVKSRIRLAFGKLRKALDSRGISEA